MRQACLVLGLLWFSFPILGHGVPHYFPSLTDALVRFDGYLNQSPDEGGPWTEIDDLLRHPSETQAATAFLLLEKKEHPAYAALTGILAALGSDSDKIELAERYRVNELLATRGVVFSPSYYRQGGCGNWRSVTIVYLFFLSDRHCSPRGRCFCKANGA